MINSRMGKQLHIYHLVVAFIAIPVFLAGLNIGYSGNGAPQLVQDAVARIGLFCWFVLLFIWLCQHRCR